MVFQRRNTTNNNQQDQTTKTATSSKHKDEALISTTATTTERKKQSFFRSSTPTKKKKYRNNNNKTTKTTKTKEESNKDTTAATTKNDESTTPIENLTIPKKKDENGGAGVSSKKKKLDQSYHPLIVSSSSGGGHHHQFSRKRSSTPTTNTTNNTYENTSNGAGGGGDYLEAALKQKQQQQQEDSTNGGNGGPHSSSSRTADSMRQKLLGVSKFGGHEEVAYNQFSEDPTEVMNHLSYDEIPRVKHQDDVIIKVETSTVTLADVIIRRGLWYEDIPLPIVSGFDIVGTIYKRGDNVSKSYPNQFREGTRVAALVKTGGNARYANVPISSLVPIPPNVPSTVAVCLVSIYMSAYQALQQAKPAERRESLRGANVLVTGANGPIGMATIQLAKRAGASMVYATGTEEHHDIFKTLGAIPLPFLPEEWLPHVKGKMDVVIDSVCTDDYASSRAALNPTGHLVCTGMNGLFHMEGSGWLARRPVAAMWAETKSKYFMSRTSRYEVWRSFQENPAKFKHDLAYLMHLVEKRDIQPTVGECVPITEVADAQKGIQHGYITGAVVCLPWRR